MRSALAVRLLSGPVHELANSKCLQTYESAPVDLFVSDYLPQQSSKLLCCGGGKCPRRTRTFPGTALVSKLSATLSGGCLCAQQRRSPWPELQTARSGSAAAALRPQSPQTCPRRASLTTRPSRSRGSASARCPTAKPDIALGAAPCGAPAVCARTPSQRYASLPLIPGQAGLQQSLNGMPVMCLVPRLAVEVFRANWELNGV